MRVLRTMFVLGALAVGYLAVQPSQAEATNPWRFNANVGYYPRPVYYYPRPVVYTAPYVVAPAYPTYYYSTGGVFASPGYAPVYSGSFYYGGYAPYYGGGVYYFRR